MSLNTGARNTAATLGVGFRNLLASDGVLRKHWVPITSAVLILASFGLGALTSGPGLKVALQVAATLIAGTPIAIAAYRALTVRVISIDLLVTVAAVGALIIGETWEAAAVTFLFALGHALEVATLNKTRSALSALIAAAPERALVIRDGQEVEIPASEVAVGESVVIKNGARVPVDGEVISGRGAIDEATITGESLPAAKAPGDKVFAGTIASGGFITVRATGVGEDTTFARIIHRVEEAQDDKAASQRFMERFASYYTPGIMVLALLVGLFTGDAVLGLTLLVIGCPGALVISIPVSLVAGIGRAARDGILIKGGEFLETAARVNAVALDKTGTLTLGKPRLTDVVVLDDRWNRDELLAYAARVEAASEHPLAQPVIDAAREAGLDLSGDLEDAEPFPGMGVAAQVDGMRMLIGNRALLQDHGVAVSSVAAEHADDLARAGRTPMYVTVDGAVAGLLAVADEPRPEAAAFVAQLADMGIERVLMLTGDAPQVAQAVANQTGISEVHAGLLPEDKLQLVKRLQAEGLTVAMVGDGVNDAPALASADVSVAMGAAGSAVAIETAGIALMASNLSRLPEAFQLARRVLNTMRQNIAVALVTVAILLAGVLFGGLTMAWGMLVHQGSVLLVIINAMRLLRPPRDRSRRQRSSASAATRAPLTGVR